MPGDQSHKMRLWTPGGLHKNKAPISHSDSNRLLLFVLLTVPAHLVGPLCCVKSFPPVPISVSPALDSFIFSCCSRVHFICVRSYSLPLSFRWVSFRSRFIFRLHLLTIDYPAWPFSLVHVYDSRFIHLCLFSTLKTDSVELHISFPPWGRFRTQNKDRCTQCDLSKIANCDSTLLWISIDDLCLLPRTSGWLLVLRQIISSCSNFVFSAPLFISVFVLFSCSFHLCSLLFSPSSISLQFLWFSSRSRFTFRLPLLIVDCWLLIGDYWLLIVDYWLWIIDCWLSCLTFLSSSPLWFGVCSFVPIFNTENRLCWPPHLFPSIRPLSNPKRR
jgi:hypothetical protein